MKSILVAGIAMAALVAVPAMAQTNSNSGASSGANRGAEQTTPVPNAQSTNGADQMQPNSGTRPGMTTSGAAAMTSAGMNEAQAKAKLEAGGYSQVTGLMVGPDGMWHGRAMKGATSMNVGLDAQGNVIAR